MSSKEATVDSSLSSSESEDPGKNFDVGLPGGLGGFRQRGCASPAPIEEYSSLAVTSLESISENNVGQKKIQVSMK
jgi:hypothetical protein